MIIMRMSGGLGNQLFQYAMGRALAVHRGTDLALDTSIYDVSGGEATPRQFALDHFNISARILRSSDTLPWLPDMTDRTLVGKVRRTAFRLVESLRPLHRRHFIIEPSFTFHPEVLQAGPDCYLSGVWQSEKYFANTIDTLRREITLHEPLSPRAQEWFAKAQRDATVSLHIRRGDYVGNAKNGTLDMVYYDAAVAHVLERAPDARTLVFSDDIAWAREHLSLPCPVDFVSDPAIADHEEMFIMSACRHHIIANSSFSWWGAWLDARPDSITIAPRQWFAADSIPTYDLIPERWVRI